MSEVLKILKKEEYIRAIQDVLNNGSSEVEPYDGGLYLLQIGGPRGVFNGYKRGRKLIVSLGRNELVPKPTTKKDYFEFNIIPRKRIKLV